MGAICSCFASEEPDADVARKIVVIGDGACGKTCLIYRFIRDEFDASSNTADGYRPTVVETVRKELQIQKGNNFVQTTILLYDTGGQEDFEHLRKQSYPNTDGVIICFSVCSETSLDNVKRLWIPEMRNFSKDVPLLLVGNKSDTRENPNSVPPGSKFVSTDKAKAMASEHNLVGYQECSALTGKGVEQVFQTIAEHAVRRKRVVATQKKNQDTNSIRFSNLPDLPTA
ncbi:ras-like GTP-binding protein Rho1 [Aplysia californica]|uniref:Ras-like GTP-binding protein Rho1 n=1 Tax=Aplysia californica TaxID=6500 RepID=A0ABM1A3Y6_APLCA|nr:ras-like GTP-binding protein Rho1 [Aplysia californica]